LISEPTGGEANTEGTVPGEIEKVVAKAVSEEHVLYRKICIHLSHRYSGMVLDEIGKHFGMKVVQSANRAEGLRGPLMSTRGWRERLRQ